MTTESRALRLEGVPLPSGRGIGGIVLLVVMFLAVFLESILLAVEFFQTGSQPDPPPLTRDFLYLNLAFSALALVGLPLLYVLVVRPGCSLRAEFGLRADRRTPLYMGLASLLTIAVLLLLSMVVYALEQAGLFQEEPSELFGEIRRILWWDLILLIPLVSGVSEEVFFRGFLQRRVGLIPASLLFGLVHIGYGTVLQVAAPFLVGLFFGVLYQRTKTLYAPIAAHFTFNFVELLVLYFVGA